MTAYSFNMSQQRPLNRLSHESINDDPFGTPPNRELASSVFDVFVGDVHSMPAQRANHVVRHEYTDHGDVMNKESNSNQKFGISVTFPMRLHEMLDKIEDDGHGDVVSWQPHGRCFLVHKPKEFADHIMPTYFKMSKFPSFLRQLNLYGFRRLTRNGPDKGAYYHELFLRRKVFLSCRIPRMRVKGNGVRARSNPESEPDFYKLPPLVTSDEDVSVQEQPIQMSSSKQSLFEESHSASAGLKRIASSDELDFAGRRFHSVSEDCSHSAALDPEILSRYEMETFLRRLNIPPEVYDDITKNIENDGDFGKMMERLVSI